MRKEATRSRFLIVSDIDGVLADTVTEALLWLWNRYGVAASRRCITEYAMEVPLSALLAAEGVAVEPSQLGAQMAAACWDNPSFYARVRPHPDYWQALVRWRNSGGSVQFVTRRSDHLAYVTASWLHAHGLDPLNGEPPLPPSDALITAADKPAVVNAALHRYGRVLFVDDARHHAERVAASCPGAEVWMPSQPWNDGPASDGVRRAPEPQIAERILELL